MRASWRARSRRRTPTTAPQPPFLERLVSESTTLFYNDLLELQLHETAFDLAVLEVARGSSGMLADARDAAVRALARDFLRRWQAVVARSDAVHVEFAELLEDVLYFMERHGLSAAQSVHAAMVVASGADGIVTVEQGFGAVDEALLAVYVPAALVPGVRSRRPNRSG